MASFTSQTPPAGAGAALKNVKTYVTQDDDTYIYLIADES